MTKSRASTRLESYGGFIMTVDIDVCVTATILRELRNNGLITQKEAEKILSHVAKQTGATLIISV